MRQSGEKRLSDTMKPDTDTPDEFFEYDAEEFLVSLALLITEGRTPEHSAKGRTEGVHCPPAKSSQPVSIKHECSDKLAQCRQASRTRSEVVVLWKNNSAIMVEVMLLPDCCYSDEGPTAEGSDLKDPAMKQDALLLERWLLEPVPRQSGDRFIEEKTLLLAVRSFVFFSQLSAWLSVSHGAVPRNILYRVSAADAELQWSFSQPPTEHVFPVPNVSHSVALKVSVQSLPRQSSYPVLNCSIHTNLSFYEKRIHERSTSQHCDSVEIGERSMPSTRHTVSKQAWMVVPECLLHARTCLSPDFPTSLRNGKLFRTKGHGYDTGISQSMVNCSKHTLDTKAQLHETPSRTFKSFSLVSSQIHNPLCHQSVGEANPLIGSLLQERQDVIARIAQHLIHCDPPTSHLNGRPFSVHDSSSVNSKRFWNSFETENSLKRDKETSFACSSSQDSTVTEEEGEGQTRVKAHTPSSCCRPDGEFNTLPNPQARRKLFLAQSSEPVHSTFLQSLKRTTSPLTCSTWSSSTENPLEKADTVVSDSQLKDKVANNDISKQCSNYRGTGYIRSEKCNERTAPEENICTDFSSSLQLDHSKKLEGTKKVTVDNVHKIKHKCFNEDSQKTQVCEQKTQLISIENYLREDHDHFKCVETQDKLKSVHDENEDPTNGGCRGSTRRNVMGSSLTKCERLKREGVTKTIPLKHSSIWKKHNFRSLDGTSTNVFHPQTGLPLLSSPVPQRKAQSGYFDLDTSFLQFKSLSTRSQQQYLNTEDFPDSCETYLLSASAPPVTSLSLLGNFEESVLNYRLEPLGIVDGFTAEVGASGLFCPTHMTLPVDVLFYSVSDDNAPSPYMGVITLESLGKRGYRVPPSGTIQVTLFNPNKTVVKMFVVIYDLREMPANQQTFLRQRTFSIPVKREINGNVNEGNILQTEERTLRYLIHLRFQSSKSGKIYLHRDVRLLFSRKSMEVDSGAAYELKSYTEAPTNPQFSPRC